MMATAGLIATLLRIAYFEIIGLWIVPYALAGLGLTLLASCWMPAQSRLAGVTFILALFFSLSIIVDRGAAPVPTLIAIGLWALDTVQFALHPPACSSLEGCLPPDRGEALVVLPFLLQWAVLHAGAVAGAWAWRGIAAFRARRSPRT